MDEDYRRQLGSAIRAAEGTPDADGDIPARREPRSGRWDVLSRPRAGIGMILAVSVAGLAVLFWFAA